jgi:YegS/Rv2252/BmrU family lipid kinase
MHSFKVIINERSGMSDKADVRRRLIEIFDQAGVESDVVLAKNGDEVARLAEAALHEKWTIIVAGGGDGTVNTVASHLLGTDKILGVLPLGTLNHFARDLRIPSDLEGAARVAISGQPTSVDVGDVEGRVFLNNSSLGLYPSLVVEREKRQKLGLGKWPAFICAAVAAFRRYPFLSVRLVASGKKFDLKTPFVFVGNNEYVMERLNIGARERLDRGALSVYVANRAGRLGLFRLALRALLGRLHEEKDFLALLTDRLTIETRHKRLRIAFDGEVDSMKPPLRYSSRPGALQVMAPKKEQE